MAVTAWWRALVIVALACGLAAAQPSSILLRDGNAAAGEGDWAKVTAIVEPLLGGPLSTADRAEAHRLAGLAAYFQQRSTAADAHFFAYLSIELDGRLDPALYPPDVIAFFEAVKIRHAAELRAKRPRSRRWLALNLLPPLGQFQNGERAKGWVVAALLGGFVAGNVASYLVLRSWCVEAEGSAGRSLVCDGHDGGARAATAVNVITGIGAIATYVYGVYDGVRGYRRRTRERAAPFVAATPGGLRIGVAGRF